METTERRGRYGDNDWKDEGYVRGTDRRDVTSRNSIKRDRSSDGPQRSDHRFHLAASRSVTEATSRGRNARESMNRRGHTAEPEWFTHGPKNRDERIELAGFGSDSRSSRFDVSGSGDGCLIGDREKDEEKKDFEARDKKPVLKGSEIDATSSSQSKNQGFYFTDFFKRNDAENVTASYREEGGTTSRFKEFFYARPSSLNSECDETTQRTSLINLFPFLNDDGSGEPCRLPPSPPIYGHRLSTTSEEEEERTKFLKILEKANLLPSKDAVIASKSSDQGRFHEFTADLKAMLKVPPSAVENLNQEKSQTRKTLPDGTKAVLAEELEANLMRMDLKDKITEIIEESHSGTTEPRFESKEPLFRPTAPPRRLLSGRRVRTVAELEGGRIEDKDDDDNDDSDAYNKLLDLVKPQTERTRQESISHHHPPPPPLSPPALRIIEQQVVGVTSSSAGAISQCPRPCIQSDTLNHRAVPSMTTSSPVVFGSQPPTNLMIPLALRKGQDLVATTAGVTAGAVNRVLLDASHLEQGTGIRDVVNVVSALLNTASTKTDVQEISPRSMDASGNVSPAFMPTAVMRKMASNHRTVDERKAINPSQDDSFSAAAAAAVTDNEKMLYSIGSSHVSSAPVANSQQMATINQSQLIQLLKNHLSATAAANQAHHPHPAQHLLQQPPVDAMRGLHHYPQMIIGGSEGPSAGVVGARWPNSMSNQDYLAQLKGHQVQGHQIKGQGTGPHPPANLHQYHGHSSLPYQQQLQAPPSNRGPVDMAAVFQHLQNTSGQPVSSMAKPLHAFSLNTAPPHRTGQPVGRPIVKGTGFQQPPHQNQVTSLAALQAILQQQAPAAYASVMHQQQQHHPVLGTGGGGGGGGIERWNQGQSTLNSNFSNNLTGMNPNHMPASLSSGRYNAANLSRLFEEDYLWRQQQQHLQSTAATTSQGPNTMIIKDIERRLGASSLSSSSHVRRS